MSNQKWNLINYLGWNLRNLYLETNPYCEEPICLEIESPDPFTIREWLSPEEARELAVQLIGAANAADMAGPYYVK